MERKASEVYQPEIFIPENERWLHEPVVSEKIDRALEWARKTLPRDSRDFLETLIKNLNVEEE